MNDSEIKNLTPKEAAKIAEGANVFSDNFPKIWEIQTKAFTDKSDVKEYKKRMRKMGYYNKQKTYSSFIHVCSVRKREKELT